MALLLVFVLLVGSGFALWYTGAYTKLPFFSSPGAATPAPSDAPAGLPDKGTPQRDALLALSVLFGDEGLYGQFQGLGDQELKVAAATYFSRAPDTVREGLDARVMDIRSMADGLPIDGYDLILALRNHAMEAKLSTRIVEEDGDRAVVEITGTERIDLDKVGGFLTQLDYGTPFDDYLEQNHGKTRAQVVESSAGDGPFRFCLSYWAEEVAESGRESLVTGEPYSVEVTMVRSESDGWLLESAPEDLPKLFFAYTVLPMDLDAPYETAMAAVGGGADPQPTDGPSAGTVQSGEYFFDLPDYGRAVLLILYPDSTFYLETSLGGDGYYAMGNYRVEGRTLLLTPEGDYYQEVMGDLSNAMFEIGADGTLALQSPAVMGLMSAGEVLSRSVSSRTESINELLLPIVEEGVMLEMRDYIEQYPSQSAFPSGIYVRMDGNAVLLVDGSPGAESLNYILTTVPHAESGSKAGVYASSGSDGGYTNLCEVSGLDAVDGMNNISLLMMNDGGIQVSSDWTEEEYIAYEPPDGWYYLYQ